MIEQLVVGLAYSLAGFLFGFFAGRVTKEVHEIKETVVPHTFVTKRDDGHQHATKLGIVVVALSLLTVFGMAYTGVEAKHNADCQSAYNARFFESFQARARANDNDRAALNALLIGVGDQTLSREERAKVFADYVQNLKKGEAERKAHPLPSPPDPRKLCEDE